MDVGFRCAFLRPVHVCGAQLSTSGTRSVSFLSFLICIFLSLSGENGGSGGGGDNGKNWLISRVHFTSSRAGSRIPTCPPGEAEHIAQTIQWVSQGAGTSRPRRPLTRCRGQKTRFRRPQTKTTVCLNFLNARAYTHSPWSVHFQAMRIKFLW